jgi:predicted secreted protein
MKTIAGILLLWLTGAGVVLPAAALADEEPKRDLVSFQVDAETEVDNDRVNVIMSIIAEHKNPARLAEEINSTMRWALQTARGNPAVKVESGAYQTYPVYEERRIVNWRGRQELRLESTGVTEISGLIGELQNRLQLQSLDFSVSAESRRKVEETLITDALASYQARAARISRALGADSYEIVEVNIQTGRPDYPVPVRAEAMAMRSRADVSPPAMESGTSRVSVQVNGRIRLQRDQ